MRMPPRGTYNYKVAAALILFPLTVVVITISNGGPPPHKEGIAHGVIVEVTHPSLPGDCAIVATEAYRRVSPGACWARLLHIDCTYPDGKTQGGHMMTAWQLTVGGQILLYDAAFLNFTLELPTHERNALMIAAVLNTQYPKMLITGAHFIE